MKPRTTQRLSWILTLMALVVGVGLRIWQYAANPSIWVDEAALARNILDRRVAALFAPLDYGQVAPPGFLLAVKLSAFLFGPSEYALRLTPIAAGISAVFFFVVTARQVLPPLAAAVATFMFATAVPLVFYSSNLKPYASDVTIALMIVAAVLHVREVPVTRRWACLLVVAGIVAVFASHAAVFVVPAAGAFVLLDGRAADRRDWRLRVALVLCWAAAVIAAVAYGLRSATSLDRIYLHRFWAAWFMPTAPADALRWLWVAGNALFGGSRRPDAFEGSFQYPWSSAFVVLLIVGAASMWHTRRAAAILLAGPIALALGASAFELYPVGTRVSLFLAPLMLLILAFGGDRVGLWILGSRRGAVACLVLVPVAVIACIRQLPPKRPEHVRPVVQHIVESARAGDALWVYYGAGQAFEYYRRMIPMPGDIRVGDCSRDEMRDYLRQLDSERGRPRVWILLTHALVAERRLILDYLDRIGQRLDEFDAPADDPSAASASTILYDLSNPEKLAGASARDFPVRAGYAAPIASCYGTMSPIQGRDRRAREALASTP